MVDRRIMVLAIATCAVAMTPAALAASYKCTTKSGISYQDKPCMDPPPGETAAAPARDARDVQRTARAGKEAERPKTVAVDVRHSDDAVENADWSERAAKKTDTLRRCAAAQPGCNATSLRDAALYLSERQLENALGSPAASETLGLERTTQWVVQVSHEGRLQRAKLTAGWGLCSDEKHYFASGQGQRACRVIIE